jgi:hypothetical protein
MSSDGAGASRGAGSEPPPPPTTPPTAQAPPPPPPTTPTRRTRTLTISPTPIVSADVRVAVGMPAGVAWVGARAFFDLVARGLPGALRFPPDHPKAGDILSWNQGKPRKGALVVEAAQYYVDCKRDGKEPHGGPPPAAAAGRGAGAAAAGGRGPEAGDAAGAAAAGPPSFDKIVKLGLMANANASLATTASRPGPHGRREAGGSSARLP